jgi:hypothetical protein
MRPICLVGVGELHKNFLIFAAICNPSSKIAGNSDPLVYNNAHSYIKPVVDLITICCLVFAGHQGK